MSDHVLRSSWTRGLLLSFCLRGSSVCEGVFLKISLLDKTFEILTKGLAMGSPVSLVVMEAAVVFHSGIREIMWLRFRTLHPRVNAWWLRIGPRSGALAEWSCRPLGMSGVDSVGGPKMVASWKHPPATLVVDRKVPLLWIWFCYVVTAVERLVGRAFHCWCRKLSSSSNMTSRFNYRPDTVLGRSLYQPTDDQVLTAVDHPIDQLNAEDYIIANDRPSKIHRVGFYSQPTAWSTNISEGGRPTFDRCSYFSVFVELDFHIDFQLDF